MRIWACRSAGALQWEKKLNEEKSTSMQQKGGVCIVHYKCTIKPSVIGSLIQRTKKHQSIIWKKDPHAHKEYWYDVLPIQFIISKIAK